MAATVVTLGLLLALSFVSNCASAVALRPGSAAYACNIITLPANYSGTITPPANQSCSCYLGVTVLTGDIDLSENTAIQTVSFPNLEEVSGSISVAHNSALKTLDLPELQKIGGNGGQDLDAVYVKHNHNLTTIHMPKLKKVTSGFTVHENQVLPALDLPELETIDSNVDSNALSLIYNAVCARYHFPKLRKIQGQLAVRSNPVLSALNLNRLEQIVGGNGAYAMWITSNDLKTLSFCSLSHPLSRGLSTYVEISSSCYCNANTTAIPGLPSQCSMLSC